MGVFQIESRAQMSMLPRLQPREFYDLVIEVAIVRPGPIQGDMVHPYLRRRDGIEEVTFPKPELKAVLGKTLGVPLFQEQAMRIAIECAGFTPAQADRLRRAVTGFRRYGDIETFSKQFIDGMIQRGFAPDFAERCFAQIRGFSTYGFPESHAASFALLVYASAWIKRYHPAAFACALLNSQPMGFYQPAQIVRDARDHGVSVRPIDVNFSQWDCTLEDADPADNRRPTADKKTWGFAGPALRLGFRQIKGMRTSHAARIVEARQSHGAFSSIADFHRSTQLPPSAVERLANADAFSSLPRSRREALWHSISLADDSAPLFADAPLAIESPPPLPQMPAEQEVMLDYATAGLSLKRHPVSFLRSHLKRRGIIPASHLPHHPQGWVKVAGLVLIRQRPGTAKGIVFVTLEDETGVANLVLRPDIFERYSAAARGARLLEAEGFLERHGKVIHVLAKRLRDLSYLIAGHKSRSRDFH